MNSVDGFDGLFDRAHASECTEFRSSTQALIRNPVITKDRLRWHGPFPMEKVPSKRALLFKEWMATRKTNTKRVAEASGVPYTTLASFVQGGTQSLRGENEEKIAAAFDATVDEIFAGSDDVQSVRRPQLVRIIGRVGADASGLVLLAMGHESWDMAPPAPGVTSKAVALEVRGHSMHTFAEDGALIYFEEQKTAPDADMLGYPCVVETEDGRVLVKRLLRGSAPGLYDLESIVGPTIRDVRLNWAAEILAIVPPRQAKRIIVRAEEAA